MIIVFVLLSVIVPFVNLITGDQAQINTSNARLVLYVGAAGLFLATFVTIMLFVRLKTKITCDGIYVAFSPFVRKWKKISKDDIAKYKLRKYNAIWEYGGYGMKTRRKAGKCYTISGNTGLQLYLKNGEKLLVGTQKKQALEYAMSKFIGDKVKPLSNEPGHTKDTTRFFGKKARKILIILAIEFVIIILIFAIAQIFK